LATSRLNAGFTQRRTGPAKIENLRFPPVGKTKAETSAGRGDFQPAMAKRHVPRPRTYGAIAAIGIIKGKSLAPDARMEQMRVRLLWNDGQPAQNQCV
jgi:hypothetical protein